MAIKYLYSGAGGAATGADWANAFTTMAAAIAALAAGDTLYVGHNHSELPAAASTYNWPGTAAAPNLVIAANSAGSNPPVAADLTTPGTRPVMGTSGAFALVHGTGHAYFYNCEIRAASGASSGTLTIGGTASTYGYDFDKCLIRKGDTAANSSTLVFGQGTNLDSYIRLYDTDIQLGAVTQSIRVLSVRMLWRGGSLITIAPNTFIGTSTGHAHLRMEGVDLSILAGSSTLVGNVSGDSLIELHRCKLNASLATVLATQDSMGDAEVIMLGCDSGAGANNNSRRNFNGAMTTDTTVYRTGGSSDTVTPFGWKAVTSANAKWHRPFELLPMAWWNDVITGNITVDIYGGGASVPNNDNVWFDLMTMDAAGNPQGTIHRGTKATPLAANAAHASDSSAWNSSPGASKFKMSQTIVAPAQKGPIVAWVKVADASATYYFDPKPVQS